MRKQNPLTWRQKIAAAKTPQEQAAANEERIKKIQALYAQPKR